MSRAIEKAYYECNEPSYMMKWDSEWNIYGTMGFVDKSRSDQLIFFFYSQ